MIFAQMDPVTSVTMASANDTSVTEAASASNFKLRLAMYKPLNTSAMKNPVPDAMAAGRWKQKMRQMASCRASSGSSRRMTYRLRASRTPAIKATAYRIFSRISAHQNRIHQRRRQRSEDHIEAYQQ